MPQLDLTIILVIAIIIEMITLFGRYVLKLKTKIFIYGKLMQKLGFKKIFHIHHLFIGLIIAIIFYFLEYPFWFNVGLGISLSDIMHHIILKIIEGNAEFHIIEKSIS